MSGMNIHVIICSVLTFAVMTAFAMLLQWLNAQWSVLGTAPIFVALIIIALAIWRWEKRHGSLLTPRQTDQSSQQSTPEQ